jgi:hypothetical protein
MCRQCQDGQTIGIPTGPDASFIISEVILCRLIDEMIENKHIKRDRFVRYYDDIEYGCEGEDEGHKILIAFERSLRNYELEINPEKVQMFSGPQIIEASWLYHLRNVEWQQDLKSDYLIEIFSFITEIANHYPDDHVFRYFLRKMRTTIIHEDAWNTYQQILFSLLQENRGNAKDIFEQLLYYKEIGWKIKKKNLKETLDRKVKQQLAKGISSELSWAIYGYLLFDLKISNDLLKDILFNGDSPSKILVTKIIYDQNISLKKDINTIVRSWGTDVLNSTEWLFAYEILVNKWHNRYVNVPLPDNRTLFEYLVENRISFLDDGQISVVNLPHMFKQKVDEKKDDQAEKDWFDFFEDDEIEGESTEEDDDEVEGASNLD